MLGIGDSAHGRPMRQGLDPLLRGPAWYREVRTDAHTAVSAGLHACPCRGSTTEPCAMGIFLNCALQRIFATTLIADDFAT
jgi:hypothetical protein